MKNQPTLFQFQWKTTPVLSGAQAPIPTLETVMKHFKIQPSEIDADFGVIEIDPEEFLFVILIDSSVSARLAKKGTSFSNPEIEASMGGK